MEGPVCVLSDEEARGEYIEQDTKGPHTQLKHPSIPVEGPVRALSDEEANGEYSGRGKFMLCGKFMPQHLYKLFYTLRIEIGT